MPPDWPLGMGREFQGVYDLAAQQVLRFERVARGERAVPIDVTGLDDPRLATLHGPRLLAELREEVELLAVAAPPFDVDEYLAGRQTPVFFGSALNNFGVAPFLAALAELAPPPQPRASEDGTVVSPADPAFTGFVFKIQANMDRQHRDSMAFLRVVSGRFEAGMAVDHPRLGRKLRLPRAHRIFARERESTEEAYPGDVVGLVNPGLFAIGDTVCSGAEVRFPRLPRFPPEHFARLRPTSVDKSKAFNKGLAQLEEEGAIQVLYEVDALRREPILAAVGELQFDVIRSRLEMEYRVETALDRLSYRSARWLAASPESMAAADWPMRGALKTRDRDGRIVGLFEGPWVEDLMRERNPSIQFAATG